MRLLASFALCTSLVLASAVARATEIVNGSFETGDLTGWTVQDVPDAIIPLAVFSAGEHHDGFPSFVSAPTDGARAVLHGFDGTGGSGVRIRLAQDVAVTASGTVIEFDYRAGWDLAFDSFCGACSDRIFSVAIEVAGGGAQLARIPVLTLGAQTADFDTGPRTGAIDLADFIGRTVRVSFDFSVPDDFPSGPALFQLDNVRVAPAAWVAQGAVRSVVGDRVHWRRVIGVQQAEVTVGTGAGLLTGASQPWFADPADSSAFLDRRREIVFFQVRELSLAGGNGLGTTGAFTQVRGTLICDTDGSAGGSSVLVDTPLVSLGATGSARFLGSIGALPAVCRSEPDIAFVIRP
jgi:hypothetical protein